MKSTHDLIKLEIMFDLILLTHNKLCKFLEYNKTIRISFFCFLICSCSKRLNSVYITIVVCFSMPLKTVTS